MHKPLNKSIPDKLILRVIGKLTAARRQSIGGGAPWRALKFLGGGGVNLLVGVSGAAASARRRRAL